MASSRTTPHCTALYRRYDPTRYDDEKQLDLPLTVIDCAKALQTVKMDAKEFFELYRRVGHVAGGTGAAGMPARATAQALRDWR